MKELTPDSEMFVSLRDARRISGRHNQIQSFPLSSRAGALIDISLGAHKHVLVLDDDSDLTAVLAAILETQGYEVTLINSAIEGLAAVVARDFDVIICDMVMPTMPGDMYYMAVSKMKPHLCSRFVFITGYGSDPKVSAFLANTPQPVLHKPFGMDDILEVVFKTLAIDNSPLPRASADPSLDPAINAQSHSLEAAYSSSTQIPNSLAAASESPQAEESKRAPFSIVPL